MSTARAELLKLLTLPALALTVALTVAVTVLLAAASAGGAELIPYARAGFLVLGVLAATSEYDDGQIRTTLLGTPGRLPWQLVRTAVLAAAATPVALTVVLVAGAGSPGYLVLTALIGASAGTVLRRPLPAIVLLFGYYYALGPVLRPRVDDGLWLPVGWTVAAVLAASWSLTRRDA